MIANLPRNVKIVCIHRGKESQGRHKFIYAEVRNEDDNGLTIVATLDYCIASCRVRNWTITNAQEVLYKLYDLEAL
jgi:hypothetical protein